MIVFLIILVASFLLQIILPLWIIVIISFVTCGLIGKTGKIALWSPFLAIALLWTGVALFKSIPNQHLLALKKAGWSYQSAAKRPLILPECLRQQIVISSDESRKGIVHKITKFCPINSFPPYPLRERELYPNQLKSIGI